MTSPTPNDPFDELRKLMSEDHCRQFVDNIYKAFRLEQDEVKTIIWWKMRTPNYFEIGGREKAK